MIYIGTSGYSYGDWIGPFYPEGMKNHEFLAFYTRHFPALEINATYSRVPDEHMFTSILQRTENKVKFTVKCHESITHTSEFNLQKIDIFTRALRPLKSTNLLGCILLQLPYSFSPTQENKTHLKKLREGFKHFSISIEFRNPKWAREVDLGEFFRKIDAGFCFSDEPESQRLSDQIQFTKLVDHSDIPMAYFRLHGKNKKAWWTDPGQIQQKQDPKSLARRYTYSYSTSELMAIAKSLVQLADKVPSVYVFFNNSPRGYAPKNAQELRKILLQISTNDIVA
jgi:uncharacterized protein YecE (DUF72 family)